MNIISKIVTANNCNWIEVFGLAYRMSVMLKINYELSSNKINNKSWKSDFKQIKKNNSSSLSKCQKKYLKHRSAKSQVSSILLDNYQNDLIHSSQTWLMDGNLRKAWKSITLTYSLLTLISMLWMR